MASEAEGRLHHQLFENGYNKRPLPVVNATDILTVYFDLAVTQIVDVVSIELLIWSISRCDVVVFSNKSEWSRSININVYQKFNETM